MVHGKASDLLVRLVVEHCSQHYELFDSESLQVLAVSVVLPIYLHNNNFFHNLLLLLSLNAHGLPNYYFYSSLSLWKYALQAPLNDTCGLLPDYYFYSPLSLWKYVLQVPLDDSCGIFLYDMPLSSASLLLLSFVELLAAFLLPMSYFLLFQPLTFVAPHFAVIVSLLAIPFQLAFDLLIDLAVVASVEAGFELQHGGS